MAMVATVQGVRTTANSLADSNYESGELDQHYSEMRPTEALSDLFDEIGEFEDLEDFYDSDNDDFAPESDEEDEQTKELVHDDEDDEWPWSHHHHHHSAPAIRMKDGIKFAECDIIPTGVNSSRDINGKIYFWQKQGTPTPQNMLSMKASIKGISTGWHGIHLVEGSYGGINADVCRAMPNSGIFDQEPLTLQ